MWDCREGRGVYFVWVFVLRGGEGGGGGGGRSEEIGWEGKGGLTLERDVGPGRVGVGAGGGT